MHQGMKGLLAATLCLTLLPVLATSPVAAESGGLKVSRVEIGSDTIAPGATVLARVSLLNEGDTSAAEPVVLKVSGLPQGFSIRPSTASSGVTCSQDSCTVSGSVEPRRDVDLLLDATASAPSGGRSSVTVSTPTSSATSRPLRIRKGAKPVLRLVVAPVPGTTVAAGRSAQFNATLVNLAGGTRSGIRVSNVVPRYVTKVTAAGPGWTCGSSCRYNPRLTVGQQSPPLRIRGVVPRNATFSPVKSASATSARHADMRWMTRIRAGSSRISNVNSVLVQTREPRVPAPVEPKVRVPDWTTRSHIDAVVHAVTPIRPGGIGRLRVHLPHNKVSRTKGDTALRVRLPRGLRVKTVQDGAWRCAGRRGLSCQLRRPISAATPAPNVIVTVRAAQKIARPARTHVSVAWRTKHGRHTDTAMDDFRVLRPLRVQARVSHRVVPATAAGRKRLGSTRVQLHADIKGIESRMRPSYRWRQVAGPRVKWIGPTAHTIGHQKAAAQFRAPVIRKRKKVTFQITAGVNGAIARDRISVILKPRKVAVFKAKKRHTKRSGKAPLPTKKGRRGLRIRTVTDTRVGSTAVTRVDPGDSVTLKAEGTGPADQWDVISGPEDAIAGEPASDTATVQAPDQPQLMVIGVRTKDGDRNMSGATVVQVAPEPGPPAPSATVSATTAFCGLFTSAKSGSLTKAIAVQGGTGSLLPGAVTATGSSCTATNAAISFSNAKLTLGAHTFSSVVGTLTPTGLSITQGTFVPPKSWSSAMSYMDNPNLSFNTGSAAVTAPWSGTGLGSLAGAVSMKEFLFLNLPAGWSGTTTMSFTPTAAQPIALDATATDGSGKNTGGAVKLTATAATDGTFDAQVAAADLAVFTGANGSQATLSGAGTVSQASAGGKVTYAVTANLNGSLTLLNGLTLQKMSASVSNKAVTLNGTAAINSGGQSVPIALAGKYVSDTTWSVKASQSGQWVGQDVTLSNLSGSLASKNSVLSFTVNGQASNLDLPDAVTVSDLTAQVTNTCAKAAKNCQADQIRVLLAISGSVDMGSTSVPFKGTANVDLTTMTVSLNVQVQPQSFGPAGIQLSNITLHIGSGGAKTAACATSSAGSEPVTFSATINDLFGSDTVSLIGEINEAGYCFYGDLEAFSPTGSATDSAFADVAMVYSSYATKVTLPAQSSPVAVAAESVGLYGSFTAPASMSSTLGGLEGKGTFSAVVTDESSGYGFNGNVDYTFDDPLYLVGSSDPTTSSLSMTEVTLNVDLSSSTMDIQLAADGNYYTPASGDGSSLSSTMPLSVGVDVDLESASFGFQATAAGGKPVQDAFGEQGLTIDNLAISGSVGGTDSLGFAADASLPATWGSSVGIQPNTPIALVIDISVTPCLQFSIGQANQTVEAVNVLNADVLVADYANVLLAPAGCQFTGVNIAPGFAFDFDGVIAGDPFDFNSALSLGGSGFAIDASIMIGQMQIGSVDMQNSTFAIDIDPSKDVLDVSFGSTVTVGDSSLQVSGSYDRSAPGSVTASFSADSQGNVSLVGFDFDNADVSFSYTQSSAGSTMSFTLAGDVSFLDQSIDGTLALTAQNGTVQTASGNFVIGVNLAVASVNGPLQFSYNADQGASGTFGPGTVDVFDLVTFSDVTGSLAADGSYQIAGYTPIDMQSATAADTWLLVNEDGDWGTQFDGTLGVSITGGNGSSASVDYSNSAVYVSTHWAEHTWDDWGSWVTIPDAGCPATYVNSGSISEPVANFFLNPADVENISSSGDGDDDTNSCVAFSSVIVPSVS